MVKQLLRLMFFVLLSFPSLAMCDEGAADNAYVHYPLQQPERQEWSFAGPLGTYDKAQLQRGLKVYRETCAVCHSLNHVAFRHLAGLGYNNAQIKAFAEQFEINDGPNAEGAMFMRSGLPIDYFPKPFANDQLAAAANNGAVPPDLSLIAKARAVPNGPYGFIVDAFTQYSSAGADYIVALLTGYQDTPSHKMVADGNWYNPYFIAGDNLAMAPPLADDSIVYDDGSPQTVEQYAHDVAAFLMWSADSHMEERKQTGFSVIAFLILFAILLYVVKRRVFDELEQEDQDA